jgi:hypothetical protein
MMDGDWPSFPSLFFILQFSLPTVVIDTFAVVAAAAAVVVMARQCVCTRPFFVLFIASGYASLFCMV